MIPGAVDIRGDGKGWNVPCDSSMPDLKMSFQNSTAELVIPGSTFLQVDFGNGSKSDILFNPHTGVFDVMKHSMIPS